MRPPTRSSKAHGMRECRRCHCCAVARETTDMAQCFWQAQEGRSSTGDHGSSRKGFGAPVGYIHGCRGCLRVGELQHGVVWQGKLREVAGVQQHLLVPAGARRLEEARQKIVGRRHCEMRHRST